jgi:hypothetical protein
MDFLVSNHNFHSFILYENNTTLLPVAAQGGDIFRFGPVQV